MGSVTFTLMVITLISKITGAFREMVFGSFFGTNDIKDIYVISQSIAALSFSFLFMSIQSTFIPMYNNVLRKDGRTSADRFTSNMTNTIVAICTVVVALFYIFMPQVVRVVAAGFTGEKFEQTVSFTRVVIFQIYFSAMNGTMIAYLNNKGNFRVTATTGIIMNVVLMLFSYLTVKTGNMYVLAIGSIASMGLQYIFFPLALRRQGYRHRMVFSPFDPDIRSSLEIAVPAMFSILVNDLSIIVDKTIATTVATNGGASALDYANKLFMIVQGVVIVSITTVTLPRMSRAAGDSLKKLKRIMNESLVIGLLLVVPATVGMMLFSEPIVRLMYERNAFTADSTIVTAGALFWYAPGLVALMFNGIFLRAFYALNDTKTPLIISIINVAVDISLNFILSSFMGLNGLAASTMIGNAFSAIALLVMLRRKIGLLGMRAFFVTLLKISGATALMGLSTLFVFRSLTMFSSNPRLLVTVLVGAIVYTVAIVFAGIPEVRRLVNRTYHKLTKPAPPARRPPHAK